MFWLGGAVKAAEEEDESVTNVNELTNDKSGLAPSNWLIWINFLKIYFKLCILFSLVIATGKIKPVQKPPSHRFHH